MNNLKEKLITYNRVRDLFYEHEKKASSMSIFSKLLQEFVDWAKRDYFDEPDFKRTIEIPKELNLVDFYTEGLSNFVDYLKEEGFYTNFVAEQENWQITVSFCSPEEFEKLKKDSNYDEFVSRIKNKMEDSLFSMVSSSLDEIFEKFCCKGKEKAYQHKDYKKFEDFCLYLYKTKFPKLAQRKDKNVLKSDDEEKVVKVLSDILLFSREYGEFSPIEAFSKNKANKLKY